MLLVKLHPQSLDNLANVSVRGLLSVGEKEVESIYIQQVAAHMDLREDAHLLLVRGHAYGAERAGDILVAYLPARETEECCR